MKFYKCGSITIQGEEWEYGYGDAGKTKGIKDDAMCSHKRNKIIVSPNHTRPLLEIVAHEVAHSFFPEHKEKTILAFGGCVDEIFRNLNKPSRRTRGRTALA
jgi:hypothetical protein